MDLRPVADEQQRAFFERLPLAQPSQLNGEERAAVDHGEWSRMDAANEIELTGRSDTEPPARTGQERRCLRRIIKPLDVVMSVEDQTGPTQPAVDADAVARRRERSDALTERANRLISLQIVRRRVQSKDRDGTRKSGDEAVERRFASPQEIERQHGDACGANRTRQEHPDIDPRRAEPAMDKNGQYTRKD